MRNDVTGWVHAWANEDPGRVAIRFEGWAITYRELARRIDFLADRLLECGCAPGDRIAYLGENHPDIIALAFACIRIGAVFFPLNWRLAPMEIKALLLDSSPVIVFYDAKFSSAAEYAISTDGMEEANIAATQLRYDDGVWFQCDWPKGKKGRVGPSRVIAADAALLMYTSGTTGAPKGALHTRDGVEWTALNVIDGYALAAQDRVLAYLPLFHVGGLLMLVLPALKVGAQVILHRRFNVELTISDIYEQRVTMLLGVATTLQAMVAHPNWAACDVSSLRLVMTGASIISKELLTVFFDRGIVASQVFGATEMGIGTCLHPQDARRKLGSVGRAARHSEVMVVDSNGLPVAAEEVGEFMVRGPGLMAHYWDKSGAERNGIENGWYRTGDLGKYDSDGFFFLLSRIKEMIISGGENIYPAEIENVLCNGCDIAEVAVIGRPDPRWGEVPIAVAVKKMGSELSIGQIRDFLRYNLSSYKHPQEIIFVDALPRNSMGKVLRSELRKFVSTYEGSNSLKIKTL